MGDRIVRLDPEWTVARFRDCGHVTHACCEAHTLGECDKCAEGAGTFGPWLVTVRTSYKDADGWTRHSDSPSFVLPVLLGLPDAGAAEHVARSWVRHLIAATGGDPSRVGISVSVERSR